MSFGIDDAGSIDRMAAALVKRGENVGNNMQKAVEYACLKVEIQAKLETTPGRYAGPFDGPPHVRTGDLRASIDHKVGREGDKVVGYVGTPFAYGRYLELGTSKMHPHPFLTPSLEKNRADILAIIRQASGGLHA